MTQSSGSKRRSVLFVRAPFSAHPVAAAIRAWRRPGLAPVLAPVIALGALALPSPPAQATEVPFASHVISNTAASARAVNVADLDRDGDLDVLSASYSDNKIAWYENDGSQNYTLHTISTAAAATSSVSAADMEGDGDLDVVATAGAADDVVWYENDGTQGFTAHTIANTVPAPYSHDVADVDGDGDLDVIAAAQLGNAVIWLERTSFATPTSFTLHTMSTDVGGAYAIHATDVDQDGDLDVLAVALGDAEVQWLENDGSQAFTLHTISAGGSPSSVSAADVDGDGDVDALSGHYPSSLFWHENDGSQSFTQRTISTGAPSSSGVIAADVDGDGDVDVLASAEGSDTVGWYENDGSQNFTPRLIATGTITTSGVAAADADGDGDLDVLSASAGNSTIAWHENRTIHRSALLPGESLITASADGPVAIALDDLDQDGDLDALSASINDDTVAWYENDGNLGFTPHVLLAAADFANSVSVADLDADGDRDVVTGSQADDTLRWLENDGSQGFTAHVVSTAFDGPAGFRASDLDQDGDLDLLSTSVNDSRVAWHENDGSQNFTAHVVSSTLVTPADVGAADLDGDGDLDLMAASEVDAKLAWYENNGSQAFTQHLLSTTTGGRSVSGVDLDGDGDRDILLASYGSSAVNWFENDSSAGFTQRTVAAGIALPRSAHAADLDGDGDLDVMSASYGDDTLAWYENDGSQTFAQHVLDDEADGARAVHAADVDGDGDLDIAAATLNEDTVGWFENLGGQFALEVSLLVAAGNVFQGATDVPMLRINVAHRGRTGDSDLELTTLPLSFQDDDFNVLTSAQANALVENLYLYRDDGDTAFDPDLDTLLTTVGHLNLTNGVHTLSFTDGDADYIAAHGTDRLYFVAIDVTADAQTLTPNQVRIVHENETPGTAEDASADIGLLREFDLDRSSPSVPCTAGSFEFRHARFGATEVDDRRAIIVDRVDGECGTVTVDYAYTGGTATPFADFRQNISGTLSFPEGVTQRHFNLRLLQDTLDEPTETVTMALSNPTGGSTLGAVATATFSIVDDDPAPVVSITGPANATEGTDVTFTVALDAVSGRDVEVQLVRGGTAVRPDDYRFQGARVVIPAGQLSVTRDLRDGVVDLVSDGIADDGETLSLTIANPVNATAHPTQGSLTVTIDDP